MCGNLSKESSIGVFDSGVGGLTVVREIMRQMPDEHIVYFGDTARVPYGSKSKDTITKYAGQIIRFLKTQQVKAIVIACNTASAYSLSTVVREFDLPIIGVIEPGARVAVHSTRNGRIGVIGTEGTISSGIYTSYIHRLDPAIKVTGIACPLFVPLVEEGWIKDRITKEVAERYLASLKDTGIDTLILGCTHYPLLRSLIMELMGSSVTLVNPAYETALDLKRLLADSALTHSVGKANEKEPYRFYVSDTAQKFKVFANSILPYDVETIQKINIEEY